MDKKAVIGTKGSVKRVQIDKDKTVVFIVVAIASVALVFSLFLFKNLLGQANYLGRVADARGKAVKQLEKNKSAASSLKESFDKFMGQDVNILNSSPTGVGPLEGPSDKIILDALPSKYDFPAIASSIELLLQGYRINGISGVDDAISQQSAAASEPIEIPIGVEVSSSYTGFKDLLDKLDRSIRPIQIMRLELSGSNEVLRSTMRMNTFYQPETGMQVKEQTVR